MNFDSASIRKAAGYNLVTAQEFMSLPRRERAALIDQGKVQFFRDGKIVPLEEAVQNEIRRFSQLMVMNGPRVGERIRLAARLTTLGKTGHNAGNITVTPQGYLLKSINGADTKLNGRTVPEGGAMLNNGDIIEVARTRLQFCMREN